MTKSNPFESSREVRQLTTLRANVAALRENVTLLNEMGNLKSELLQNGLNAFNAGAFGGGGTAATTSFASLAFNNVYAPLTLNWQILMYMYKTHGVLQAALDMPVQDAFRGGLDFHSDELDSGDIDDLNEFLERSDYYAVIKQAEVWARLFGGAAVYIHVDGEDPKTPLNMNRLKGKKIKFFHLNRWELVGSFGRNDSSFLVYEKRVDASRILTITGKEAPYILKWILQGWGMSDLERLVEPFNLFLANQNAIFDLLKEAKIDIIKFKGFASQLVSDKGTNLAINRVRIMNAAKTNNSALVMDKEDEYEQKTMTFSGLAEMWNQNRIGLASAVRIPMTKLFGISAAGFSSGEDDIENYNAYVESDVREHIKPTLRKTLEVVQMVLFGNIFDLKFQFKPLRVLGSEEEERIKSSKSNRFLSLYSQGLLTPQELMELQQKEGLVTIETEVSAGADPQAPLGQGMDDADDDGETETPEEDKSRGGKQGGGK